MNIFISWSGERSRAVAGLLHNWIPKVIQSAKPWCSTDDLKKGTVWFSEITKHLQENDAGIVCLTPENREAPWIMFEAGALAMRLKEGHLFTFLVDLKHTDIKNPLAQFNTRLRRKKRSSR